MHELVHLSLCLEGEGKAAFIDDLDLRESSRMEKEADGVAENVLFPPALWESSATRVKPTPMAVAAGRVRFEHKNHRLMSRIVGRG